MSTSSSYRFVVSIVVIITICYICHICFIYALYCVDPSEDTKANITFYQNDDIVIYINLEVNGLDVDIFRLSEEQIKEKK